MKFRILEQRGKFRIQEYAESWDYTIINRLRVKVRRLREELKEWVFIQETYEKAYMCDGRRSSFTASRNVEFDTYKQAENYVKKHYGLEGVKSIEKPEWRVA